MKSFRLIMIGFYVLLGSVSFVFSAEKKAQLIFSELSVKPGQKFEIPVLLNDVPNMAGIKLALKFDKDLLTYVKSEKTKITASLMHIVNDKHPGKLVIVMAGARGVEVNNQSIMNLFFKVNDNITKPVDTKFIITELQLMSDSLKELAYEFNIHPIHIKASGNTVNSKSDQKSEILKQTEASKVPPKSKVQENSSESSSELIKSNTQNKISESNSETPNTKESNPSKSNSETPKPNIKESNPEK